MEIFTSASVLSRTVSLPLPHSYRPSLADSWLVGSRRLFSASPTPSPASWSSVRKNCTFPPHYVAGADSDDSIWVGSESVEEEDDVEMEERDESEFVEIGYISSAHGLRGEVRVKPSTDFPELRFAEPGRRWLKTYVSGKRQVHEVELMGGRSHPGQKTWILSFSGVDTVDKAKQIVGSTMLVKEDDRPELDEGEFYTPDLFGMTVILKESGKCIGTVVNVVNYGSSDLLQVMLNTEKETFDGGALGTEGRSSGRLVWVPFVEPIVPEVDTVNRQMFITPPKGLLELNMRSDTRSKKERRQMEWKQRKKLQQRIISAKKKLAEIGQEHVLGGLFYGVKDKKRLLSSQIADINLQLFQHALGNIKKKVDRGMYDRKMMLNEKSMQISHRCYNMHPFKQIDKDHNAFHAKGIQLISQSKVAIILILECKRTFEPMPSLSQEASSRVLQFKNALSAYKIQMEVQEHGLSLPLIILCPAHELQFYQELLFDHDYFGFDSKRVWILEEEKLPIVDIIADGQNRHQILLHSPWEILQSPLGPGAIFSTLSKNKILDILNEMHVEYVQMCSLDERCVLAHPLFLGLASSHEVDVGIKIFAGQWKEDEIDMIFTSKYLSTLIEQEDKLQFYAVPEKNNHIILVDGEWINVVPSEPNSYRLHCPASSLLDMCPDDVSVLSIVD